MSVLIETNQGNLVIDLDVENSPNESYNFIKLCKLKYYHYSPFINIEKDYSVMSGNPSYPHKSKVINLTDKVPNLSRILEPSKNKLSQINGVGSVGFLLNPKSNSFTSEFIITLTNNTSTLKSLDSKITIFGRIAEGFPILEKINNSLTDEDKRPFKDIRILHTFIVSDPFPDPDFGSFISPPLSPYPTGEQIDSFRLFLDDSSESETQTDEELKEIVSTSAAFTLKLLNDIPSASIKPSEFVLFICKLNPITTEPDLALIFSRFGNVRAVEIIKDKETKESLCYGFIEFDNRQSVEKAYLKMRDVFIDDRKVLVDFSQSVKKTKSYNTDKDDKKKRRRFDEIDHDNDNDTDSNSERISKGVYARNSHRDYGNRYKNRWRGHEHGNGGNGSIYRNQARNEYRSDRYDRGLRSDSEKKSYRRKQNSNRERHYDDKNVL